MTNWATMSAGDFYTDGTQLNLLADIEGDGYGTIPMEIVPDEVAAAAFVERADGALFGLALSDEPADGDALFSVVAA